MTTEVTWLWDDYFPDDGQISKEAPKPEGDALFEDDEWEDGDFVSTINDKFPSWYLVKMLGFTWRTFEPIEEWCQENTKHGQWQKVGWETGCSYSVGVVFESPKDAMMFKLRWR
jgi:hypothetical protein